MGKKKERLKKGQIRSKKKDGKHYMDQLSFKNRTEEKRYENLVNQLMKDHVPKIMDLVSKEERAERGDKEFKNPGSLYKNEFVWHVSKDKYLRTARTVIKYLVTKEGVREFSDITVEKVESMFQKIAENLGTDSDQYSKKTYDHYVDASRKMFTALSRSPEEAKVQLNDRKYAGSVLSIKEQGLHTLDFAEEMRKRIPDWSNEDYKRGKEGGYSISDAQIIMKQAMKHKSLKEQLAVALYVHGGLRNEEGRNMTDECFNVEKQQLELLLPNMNKQDRPRVIMDVDKSLFDLFEQYKASPEYKKGEKILDGWDGQKVRDLIKDCCRLGKIGYSGVHDLRKSYVAKIERDMQKDILKGKITKKDLIDRIMAQVSVDPRLNPIVNKKEWRSRITTSKNGEKRYKYYPVNKKDENGNFIKDYKYIRSELEAMTIENVFDLFVAEQIGHNKTETNREYENKETKKLRKEFRDDCKRLRKEGKKE